MYTRSDTQAARTLAYREVLDTIGPAAAGKMYQVLTERLYSKFLRSGDIALDCGASVGRHAIGMARAVGAPGQVHAFEPSPAVFPKLCRRLDQARVSATVRVHEVALGHKEGVARFHVLHGALGMSGLQPREFGGSLREKIRVEEVSVDVKTVDQIVSSDMDVRFVKLDLEGGEYHALVGARGLLVRSRPVIVFENGRGHSAKDYGYGESEFFRLFAETSDCMLDGLGFPFTAAQWALGSVPWQFIAVLIEDRQVLSGALEVVRGTLHDHDMRTQD